MIGKQGGDVALLGSSGSGDAGNAGQADTDKLLDQRRARRDFDATLSWWRPLRNEDFGGRQEFCGTGGCVGGERSASGTACGEFEGAWAGGFWARREQD